MKMHPKHTQLPMSTFMELHNWISDAVPTTAFIRCVLSNDLRGAVTMNTHHAAHNHIGAVVEYMVKYAPAKSWGSRRRMREWSERLQNRLWEHK